MTVLEKLTLDNNYLKTLPVGSFKDLNQLQELSLANNKINLKTHGTFSGLHRITALNIANNTLQSMSALVTQSLEHLYTLNVTNNNISVFETKMITSVLTNLRVISINGNVFNCSYLERVLIGFKEKDVRVEMGHEYLTENIKGIACKDDFEDIKHENNGTEEYNFVTEVNVENEVETHGVVLQRTTQHFDYNKKKSVLKTPSLNMTQQLDSQFANFENVLSKKINACVAMVILIFILVSAAICYSIYMKRKSSENPYHTEFTENNL